MVRFLVETTVPQDKPGFTDNREHQRRQGEDRRKEERVNLEQDTARSNRREGGERRSWPFGLIYNTPHAAATIEKWMGENCAGDWHIGCDEIDTDGKLNSFKVMFENNKDKQAFVTHFTG